MEGLPDPCKEWTLEADKKLFNALQEFSALFLTRIKEAEAAVTCLAKKAQDAEIRANCAQASFRQLANSHYIEETVGDPGGAVPHSLTLPVSSQAVLLTPANFDQVVQPRYAEAIRLASRALEASSSIEEAARPLPYMYGSPEYLQDAHGGLGPLIPGWQPPPPAAGASGVGPEWMEYSSAAASTVGEFDADDFSMAEGASEASGVHRLPDFKSMLEAALRGDVGDDGPSGSHRRARSSGSTEGPTAPRPGLEPISEGLFQDASGELPQEQQPAAQNLDVQDAIHASLDLDQHAQPSSAQHTGVTDGSAFADADYQKAVSRALDSGVAEPANSQAPQQAKSERPPLSEELLSRHSASMDQLSEAHSGTGLNSSHQQAPRRSNGEREKGDRAGKQIKSYPVAEEHQAGGLFDDDEAVEELMQGLQELQSQR